MTNLVLADFLVVDVTKPYVEQGSFLEIELAARRGEEHETCGGRTLNDDVMDTLFTQLINAGNGPTIRDGVDQSTRPASHTFPYLVVAEPGPAAAARAPPLTMEPHCHSAPGAEPSWSSTTSRAGRCTSDRRRTSGPTCCCASTIGPPAASWCDDCSRWSTPDGRRPIPPTTPGSRSPSPTTGLQALGVPQDSLDTFAPEFRQGMAARAAELGDVGESSPANWEAPLGTRDVHVAIAALSPDAARLEAVLDRARRAHEGAARCRADLASGLLPAADRTDVVRLQGRDRPAGRRGQRHPTDEPEGAAAQGRRDHPRLPRRDR